MCEQCERIKLMPCTVCGLPSEEALQHVDSGEAAPYCLAHLPCQYEGCDNIYAEFVPDIDGNGFALCVDHIMPFILLQVMQMESRVMERQRQADIADKN